MWVYDEEDCDMCFMEDLLESFDGPKEHRDEIWQLVVLAAKAGIGFRKLRAADLQAFLFERIPRDAVISPERAGPIIAALRTFIDHAERDGRMLNVSRWRDVVGPQSAEQLRAAFANEHAFSPAKKRAIATLRAQRAQDRQEQAIARKRRKAERAQRRRSRWLC
jgi:hypothetical protein